MSRRTADGPGVRCRGEARLRFTDAKGEKASMECSHLSDSAVGLWRRPGGQHGSSEHWEVTIGFSLPVAARIPSYSDHCR